MYKLQHSNLRNKRNKENIIPPKFTNPTIIDEYMGLKIRNHLFLASKKCMSSRCKRCTQKTDPTLEWKNALGVSGKWAEKTSRCYCSNTWQAKLQAEIGDERQTGRHFTLTEQFSKRILLLETGILSTGAPKCIKINAIICKSYRLTLT